MMDSKQIFAAMKEAVQGESSANLKKKFKGSVVFVISDKDEKYSLDMSGEEASVQEGELPNPDLTVIVTSLDMASMISGELKPQQAFMKGKLKIKGKANLAMKLTTILAATRKKMPKTKL